MLLACFREINPELSCTTLILLTNCSIIMARKDRIKQQKDRELQQAAQGSNSLLSWVKPAVRRMRRCIAPDTELITDEEERSVQSRVMFRDNCPALYKLSRRYNSCSDLVFTIDIIKTLVRVWCSVVFGSHF